MDSDDVPQIPVSDMHTEKNYIRYLIKQYNWALSRAGKYQILLLIYHAYFQ